MRDGRGSCVERIIMTLRAYLDDSGKLADPIETVTIVGGCIATVEEWDELEKEWWSVISAYDVKEFHAVDFAHSKGDFLDWPEDKRRAFLGALVEIMRRNLRNPSKPIGGLLPLSQFRNLSSERQAEWGDDPYFVCLQQCIQQAAVHAQDLYVTPENVEIYCDEQPTFEGIAKRVYGACKQYLPNGMGDRLCRFAFGASKKWAGLQVADLVAYEGLQMRRDMVAGLGELLIDKPRWPLGELFAAFQCEFEYYTAQKLWEREPLIDYSNNLSDSRPEPYYKR